MSNPLAETLAKSFETTFRQMQSTISSIEEGKRLHQVKTGKSHPLWLLGHVANSNSLMVHRWVLEGNLVFPKEWIKRFSPDFAGGEDPSTDPGFYPAWDEIADVYNKVCEACIAGIKELDDAALMGELKGGAPDAMKQMFGNMASITNVAIYHSEYHRGQMVILNSHEV